MAYTLVRNKAYKNVSSIFEDEDRRDLENDTMTVIRGLEGSYPNFFYSVDLDETEPLRKAMRSSPLKIARTTKNLSQTSVSAAPATHSGKLPTGSRPGHGKNSPYFQVFMT